jgi:hypothetical protein
MLGSYGRHDWLDTSDYLVYFAKGTDVDGYNTIMSILGQRVLRRGPTPFGFARRIPGVAESQRAICFSEIPLGFTTRLVERRGTCYGISFHKRFILARGGCPLWYVEHGTPQHAVLEEMRTRAEMSPSTDNPFWKLTPFIDEPSGPDAPYRYDFRWEREWRMAADLAFSTSDVAFLFIPERLHADARSFFARSEVEDIGPSYLCPYIDPTWDVGRIVQSIVG